MLGVMSGTSLDGVDLVLARFHEDGERWRWEILAGEARSYTEEWREKLSAAFSMEAPQLLALHAEYGHYLGGVVRSFLAGKVVPLAVVSHGHTVFHRPDEGYTFQLGEGSAVAAESGLPVVYDLRAADVALGGEGAPLVPVGDWHLFGDYGLCLNLGGFSNVSYESEGRRIAFDICPVNLAMQHLVKPLGLAYDRDGELGRAGRVDERLLAELEALDYYHQPPPRSLGREWLEEVFLPLFDRSALAPQDKLRTLYEHIVRQIVGQTAARHDGRMLVTGGGAHNRFLMELLRQQFPGEVVIPSAQVVDLKEALIFAFLGLLRLLGRPNTLASVTGALRDVVAGSVADPWGKLEPEKII